MDGWKNTSASITDFPSVNPRCKNNGTIPNDTAVANMIPTGIPIQANFSA